MGNCIRKGSSMEWGGEDWGSFGSGRGEQEGSLPRESKDGVLAAGTEVKIKISRKELEKLLKEADIEGLTAQQVLAQLMNTDHGFEAHQRSWRPALHTIPE